MTVMENEDEIVITAASGIVFEEINLCGKRMKEQLMQILTDFQNSFTGTLNRKSATVILKRHIMISNVSPEIQHTTL